MIAKTKERCTHCKLQITVCMCSHIPSITTGTKLILIVHAHEVHRPTNTGTLAARCLSHSEVHIRGQLGAEALDTSNFIVPERESLVLFPDEGAQELTPDFVRSLTKPVTLIVPDGNWQQAGRIPKREPKLRGLPRVTLPLGALSEYRLRREPKRRPEGLATMEAIARAFAILEGEDVYEQLMSAFRMKVARSLWVRGTLTTHEVFGASTSRGHIL